MKFVHVLCQRKILAVGLVLMMATSACVSVAEPLSSSRSAVEDGLSYAQRLLDFQDEDGALYYSSPKTTTGTLNLIPYFSNLAALAWVEAARLVPADDPRRETWLTATQRWLDWYAAHMNPDGTVDDYVGPVGQLESKGTYDSSDSYGSTFALLLWRYYEASGDLDYVKASLPTLRGARAAINLTRGPDGLTYAIPFYSLRYLMDNSEVAVGLAAMSRLFDVCGQSEDRLSCIEQLDQIRAHIAGYYHPDLGYFGYYMEPFPLPSCTFKDAYPDAMANLMVLVWLAQDQPQATALFDRLWEEFWVKQPVSSRTFAQWWAWAAFNCDRPQAYELSLKALKELAAPEQSDCVTVGMAGLCIMSGSRALRMEECLWSWEDLAGRKPLPALGSAPSIPQDTHVVVTGAKLASPLSHNGGWSVNWNGSFKLPCTLKGQDASAQISLVFPGTVDWSAMQGIALRTECKASTLQPKFLLTVAEEDGELWQAPLPNSQVNLQANQSTPVIFFAQMKRSNWGRTRDNKLDTTKILGLRLELLNQDQQVNKAIITLRSIGAAK